jgi:DNA-binding LytR/AlgR family response regulator
VGLEVALVRNPPRNGACTAVVVAHRKAVVRRAIRRALDAEAALGIVAECAGASESALGVLALKPSVAIVSDEIASSSVVLHSILRALPQPHVILIDGCLCSSFPSHPLPGAERLHSPLDPGALRATIRSLRQTPDGCLARPNAPETILRIPTRPYGPRASVSSAECLWIESDGNAVRVHTTSRTLTLRVTLNTVERLLRRSGFGRVSRRALINLTSIDQIVPIIGGGHRVRLTDQTEIRLSPEFAKRAVAGLCAGPPLL